MNYTAVNMVFSLPAKGFRRRNRLIDFSPNKPIKGSRWIQWCVLPDIHIQHEVLKDAADFYSYVPPASTPSTWSLISSSRESDLRNVFAPLKSLKDGWLDGYGTAPDQDALSSVAEQMVRYPNDLPIPAVVPTPEGNLLFEWEAPGDPSIDLDLNSKTAVFHCFTSDGNDEEKEFSLERQRDWSDLFGFLKATIQR